VANLAVIGRLELLRLRYGSVSIPPRVSQELARLSHAAGRANITAALAEGWLVVEVPSITSLQLPFRLDPGEEEAIALAVGVRADVLLMDEKRGRAAARKVGVKVAGVLGELLHAKRVGRLPALRPEIQRLRDEAGFFVDASIEQFLLSQAGEE
jgi:hypothetical protein